MFSGLWHKPKTDDNDDCCNDDVIQHVYNGVGSYDRKGTLCEVPKFIGPNFNELTKNTQPFASLSSYSRTIPRKEIDSALGVTPDISLESNSKGLSDLPTFAKSGLTNKQPRTSALENNCISRLRLKAQYIFNVFEKVDAETESEQEIFQHVSNSLISTEKSVKKSVQNSSLFIDPYYLLKSAIVVAILYFIYFLGKSFWHDYSVALNMAIQENLNRQDKCISHYTLNKCFSPLPPLVGACAEWAQCIQSDPDAVERTALVVRLFARLTSAFLHALTIREISIIGLCTFIALMAILVFRNLFG